MSHRGRGNIEVVGMAGEQYVGGAGDDVLFKGGYKSQLSDDPPWNYIGTSQLTEDLTGDVKSDGRISGSPESSVFERTFRCGLATRREPITFETGKKRKKTNNII